MPAAWVRKAVEGARVDVGRGWLSIAVLVCSHTPVNYRRLKQSLYSHHIPEQCPLSR